MRDREELGNDLLRAAARLTRWASRHASFDVPYAQARLLALLDELGPARVSALAEADNTSQPSMTTALHRLEKQGWAQREPDPTDARASLLSLTPAGRKALHGVRASRVQALAPTLDALDDADLSRLHDAVALIEHLLRRAAQRTEDPELTEEPQHSDLRKEP